MYKSIPQDCVNHNLNVLSSYKPQEIREEDKEGKNLAMVIKGGREGLKEDAGS